MVVIIFIKLVIQVTIAIHIHVKFIDLWVEFTVVKIGRGIRIVHHRVEHAGRHDAHHSLSE